MFFGDVDDDGDDGVGGVSGAAEQGQHVGDEGC